MIPYRYKEDKPRNCIVINAKEAIAHYQKFNRNVKFDAVEYFYRFFSENEVIFSRAISKFQNLVIFEE